MATRSPAGRPKPVEVGTLFANATSRQRKNGQGLVQWYWRARRKVPSSEVRRKCDA